ncbi:MAG: tetratricopeptide repeat protein [Acidobacteria bacterium]|nr:tetratricopeptide repeat protein [Acidobacteriota bacterium]
MRVIKFCRQASIFLIVFASLASLAPRAVALSAQGTRKQARTVKRDKSAARRAPTPEDFFRKGNASLKAEQYQEAVEAFKEATRLKPDFTIAYNNLGVTYGRVGQYAEAIEAYKRAIGLNPGSADTYFNLGVAYGKAQRYDEAIAAYAEAIRLKPEYADAYFNSGLMHEKLEQHAQAVESYKRVLSINPDYPNARKYLEQSQAFLPPPAPSKGVDAPKKRERRKGSRRAPGSRKPVPAPKAT